MNWARPRSGYIPLSGAASRRPLVIKLVAHLGHFRIFLATFRDPAATFPQLIGLFCPTRRRNLGLGRRTPVGPSTSASRRVRHRSSGGQPPGTAAGLVGNGTAGYKDTKGSRDQKAVSTSAFSYREPLPEARNHGQAPPRVSRREPAAHPPDSRTVTAKPGPRQPAKLLIYMAFCAMPADRQLARRAAH